MRIKYISDFTKQKNYSYYHTNNYMKYKIEKYKQKDESIFISNI